MNSVGNILGNILPEDVINKIDDFTYKENVNGKKRSNEIIVIFDLNESATDVHDKLMNWLLKCLDTISYKVLIDGSYKYEWNIISQIKTLNIETYDKETQSLKLMNSIIVAIHINNYSYGSTYSDGLTIPYIYTDNSQDFGLTGEEVISCFKNKPRFINNLGVSAVSEDVMKFWWKEIISNRSNIFPIPGKGPNKHPMHIKYSDTTDDDIERDNWYIVKEQSCNFKWKNYYI